MTTFKLTLLACFILVGVCACTLSFTNVSTHGTASDVVDDTQSPVNELGNPVSPK